MTVRRSALGDIITTRFTTKPNELGVEETWEDVTLETHRESSETQRLRLLTARELGRNWPTT